MKKVLKFAGAFAFVLALVAFILLMATKGIKYEYDGGIIGKLVGDVEGSVVLFGKTEKTVLGDVVTKAAPTALVAWILIIVATVALLAGVVLPLLKAKDAQKIAGLMNVCAALLLVVGGVLLFFTVNSFTSVNDLSSYAKYHHLTAGWIVSAILALLGGVVALLPACVDFVGKKKKK